MQIVQAIRPTRSFLLIDDDKFSARFFTQQLQKCAAGQVETVVKWMTSAEDGVIALNTLSAKNTNEGMPDLIVVDLKASSSANLDFLHEVSLLLQGTELRLAVFSATKETAAKQALKDAGAVAVFERHADLKQFGIEMENLLSLSAQMARAA